MQRSRLTMLSALFLPHHVNSQLPEVVDQAQFALRKAAERSRGGDADQSSQVVLQYEVRKRGEIRKSLRKGRMGFNNLQLFL